jgi:cell division initiation protein
MRVTPLDIRKQEFKKVMRGLDSEEVYAFLNTIAEEYEAVLSDNKNLRERIVAIEERLNEYKGIETNLRNTLITAEKLTQEAKENARREASLMIREAEMEADRAAETIRANTSQLRREILELKKNKDNYINRLKTLLDSHRKMIDGFEEDFAGVDQQIEMIGKQVEEDVKKGTTPPRMSRDKITEDFGHESKDKVTWGEERRREEEPRPSMPKPGFETHEAPGRKTKSPEDTNVFARPGMGQDMYQGAATQQPGPKPAEQLRMEPLGGVTSETMPAPQSHPISDPAGEPRAQGNPDNWRQYEVRKQQTDWKNYEIQGQKPQQPAVASGQQDQEVESALSSLREATGAAEEMPRQDMNQMTARRPANVQAAPAEPENTDTGTESAWSMEDLRKNLTNLSKNEGNQD